MTITHRKHRCLVFTALIFSAFLSWTFPAQTTDAEADDIRTGEPAHPNETHSDDDPLQFRHPFPLPVEGGMAPLDPGIDEQDASTGGEKRYEFAVAPIPIVNPTIGGGGGGIATFLYRLDPDDTESPPATTTGGGFYTSSESWGLGGVQKLFLFEDRIRITAGGAYFAVNYDYYGKGNESGAEGISIPLHQNGSGLIAEGLYRIWERFFIGASYRLIQTRTELNIDWDDLPLPIPPPDALEADIAALGLRIQRDSRDNQHYPFSGSLLDFTQNFYDESFGSDFNYRQTEFSFSKFIALSPRQVLAMRFSGCHTNGDAPFFGLCTLGNSKDIRGYEAGRFRDQNFLAGQAEYRLQLPWRFGVTGFGGLGEVAETFDGFNFENIRPSIGGGIRFMLAPQNRINLRFDFAVGEDSSAWYVGLMEAF